MVSTSLVFLMLASSFGLTFATHYCGGHAVASVLALGHIDLDCGMKIDHADAMRGHTLRSKTCCENEYVSVEVDDQFSASLQEIAIDFKCVVACVSTPTLPHFQRTQIIAFSDYFPPPLIANMQVVHQTFLL